MFGMVVLFGLFHGLILTPIMLSLIGPTNRVELKSRSAGEEHVAHDNNGMVEVDLEEK